MAPVRRKTKSKIQANGRRGLCLGANHPTRKTTETAPNATSSTRGDVPVSFGDAINFINDVKSRFTENPSVYKQFLEVLMAYKLGRFTLHEVYAQTQLLFQDEPEIIESFKLFMPDTSGRICSATVAKETAERANRLEETKCSSASQM